MTTLDPARGRLLPRPWAGQGRAAVTAVPDAADVEQLRPRRPDDAVDWSVPEGVRRRLRPGLPPPRRV